MEDHAQSHDGSPGHNGYRSDVYLGNETAVHCGIEGCTFKGNTSADFENHFTATHTENYIWRKVDGIFYYSAQPKEIIDDGLLGYNCPLCPDKEWRFENYTGGNALAAISAYNEALGHMYENHGIKYPPESETSVPVYGFKCNGCDFSTISISEMQMHDAANGPEENHDGYKYGVTIEVIKTPNGTQEVPTGYKVCIICKQKAEV